MKIKIAKKEILKGLQRVQGIAEKKTTQPILTYVLIRTLQDKILIISTDLKIILRATYDAEVIEEGEITISAKILYNIIREIDSEEITLYSKVNERIIVESGKSIFKLMGIDPCEYPEIREINTPVSIVMQRDGFLEMINKTLFTVGTEDDSGYTLGGIEVQVATRKGQVDIQFAGTDGHRLAVIKRSVPVINQQDFEEKFLKLIIPKKTIIEMKKLLLEDDGEVTLLFGDRNFVFKKNNVEVVSRLLEGMYPQYEKVIPENIQKKIYINRTSFERAIRRVSLLTSEVTNCIEMTLESGRVVLRSENPMVGDAMESLDVEYTGNGMLMGFNFRYMLDMLPVVDNEKILIEIEDYDKPMLVKDVDDPDFVYLLMPVMFKEKE